MEVLPVEMVGEVMQRLSTLDAAMFAKTHQRGYRAWEACVPRPRSRRRALGWRNLLGSGSVGQILAFRLPGASYNMRWCYPEIWDLGTITAARNKPVLVGLIFGAVNRIFSRWREDESFRYRVNWTPRSAFLEAFFSTCVSRGSRAAAKAGCALLDREEAVAVFEDLKWRNPRNFSRIRREWKTRSRDLAILEATLQRKLPRK